MGFSLRQWKPLSLMVILLFNDSDKNKCCQMALLRCGHRSIANQKQHFTQPPARYSEATLSRPEENNDVRQPMPDHWNTKNGTTPVWRSNVWTNRVGEIVNKPLLNISRYRKRYLHSWNGRKTRWCRGWKSSGNGSRYPYKPFSKEVAILNPKWNQTGDELQLIWLRFVAVRWWLSSVVL